MSIPGGTMTKRFAYSVFVLVGCFVSSFCQATTTAADDIQAGFNLGTQSSLFVANAIKACDLSDKEANALMGSQKKAGLELYGQFEPNFSTNFDQGFNKSFPLIQKSLSEGTLKIDRSICKSLNIKTT